MTQLDRKIENIDDIVVYTADTMIVITYETRKNISNFKIDTCTLNNLENLTHELKKNFWNQFYYITISYSSCTNGYSYHYTIPSGILNEITDLEREVVNFQSSRYKKFFPRFLWINLFEYFINSNKIILTS